MKRKTPGFKTTYVSTPLWEKAIAWAITVALLTVVTWRLGGDEALVGGVSAFIALATHLVLTYTTQVSLAVVYLIHLLVMPLSAVAYAVVLGRSEVDYLANFAVLIFGTLTLSVLAFRLRHASTWKVLAVAFAAMDIVGFLLIIFVLGVGYGAPIGVILGLLSLLLWLLLWHRLRRSRDTSSERLNPAPDSFWKDVSATSSMTVADLDGKFAPLNKIIVGSSRAYATVGIKPLYALKMSENRLRYRYTWMESLYIQALDATEALSRDKHIDARSLATVIAVDADLPGGVNVLTFEVWRAKSRSKDIVHVVTAKGFSELEAVLPAHLSQKNIKALGVFSPAQ